MTVELSRRSFLMRGAAAVAAMAIDPELLVWSPRSTVAVPSNYVRALETVRRRVTIRTGLPAVAWRKLNEGVQVSPSRILQRDIDLEIPGGLTGEAREWAIQDKLSAFRRTDEWRTVGYWLEDLPVDGR